MVSFTVLSFLALQTSLAFAFNKTSKRGITFIATNNPADVLNINQTHSQISWVYDWGLDVPSYLQTSNLEYIPMQWGAAGIANLSTALQAQGSKTVLGFNEPDFNEQSNIDPTYAAQLWQQYMNPLKAAGIRIGGPAVSSSGTGQPWLTQFFAACNNNCTMDFLPLHWYGVGVAGFYDYIFQIHGQFPNMTIWITEFADTSLNTTEVSTFLNQSTVYLDGLDWVERYSWFGYFRPQNGSDYNFLNADGGLNSLGQAYIGAGSVEESGPIAQTTTTVPGGGEGGATLVTISVATNAYTPSLSPNSAIRGTFVCNGHLLWSIISVIGAGVLGMIWTIW